MLAPEHDHTYTAELKRCSQDALAKTGVQWEYVYFPGVRHGFALRGDPEDKTQKEGLERAKRCAVELVLMSGCIEMVGWMGETDMLEISKRKFTSLSCESVQLFHEWLLSSFGKKKGIKVSFSPYRSIIYKKSPNEYLENKVNQKGEKKMSSCSKCYWGLLNLKKSC